MSKALIDRFAMGDELMLHATSGLGPEHMQARPGPGDWSLAELIAHLCDSELVAGDRMKRVIAEDNPTLLAYDENRWIERVLPDPFPLDDAVNLFVANRRWLLAILRKCTPDDFARAGQHTESGRKTLSDLVAGYIQHLDHHLRFLYGKRANLGIAVYPRYSAD